MGWIYVDTTNQNFWGWNSYTGSEAENNAREVWSYLQDVMTLEACCGILGNACYESKLNPAQEQVYNTTPLPPQNQRGLGLIQWTPQGDLRNFVDNPWYDGNNQCQTIVDEITGVITGRWLTTSSYPYTGQEYMELTDVEEATKAYFYERERGTWNDQRLTLANHWYDILSEEPPVPPVPPQQRSKMPLYMYTLRQARYKKGIL